MPQLRQRNQINKYFLKINKKKSKIIGKPILEREVRVGLLG